MVRYDYSLIKTKITVFIIVLLFSAEEVVANICWLCLIKLLLADAVCAFFLILVIFTSADCSGNFSQAGLTAADVEIGDWLRKKFSHKCIILAVNKCESPRKGLMQASDFWSLG